MSSPLHQTTKGDNANAFDESERIGLTTEQAEELYKQYGYNELPEISVSLWYILFVQFTGTMPYMLELACIIALAVEDYPDFGIILAMLLANGFLGFHEQLKAAESLVSVRFYTCYSFIWLKPQLLCDFECILPFILIKFN